MRNPEQLTEYARGLGIRIEATAQQTATPVVVLTPGEPPAAEGQAETPPQKRRGRPPKQTPAIPAVGTGSDDSTP